MSIDFVPGTDNHIILSHRHIFLGFKASNLEEIKAEKPGSEGRVYYIFLHDNSVEEDNTALVEMLHLIKDRQSRWRIPIGVAIYAPMRHTKLRRWFEDYLSPYNELFKWVFVGNVFSFGEVFDIPLIAQSNERLMIQVHIRYEEQHINPQLMSVGYEEIYVDQVTQGDTKFIKLGEYEVKPNDDWISSGMPGYR